jgi:hypothetical protein
MIDGLRLTMTGEKLRKRLDERVAHHKRLVEHYKREAKREPDPKDENDFVLPEHMCEFEVELHEWRAEVLAYLREHIEGGEVYHLGQADVEFGELLPQKPGVVEQDEFERENSIGFSMERIAKEAGSSNGGAYAIAQVLDERLGRQESGSVRARTSKARTRRVRRARA